MQISLQHSHTVHIESPDEGLGQRRLYIGDSDAPSGRVEHMTHRFLPAGECYDWNSHESAREVVFVIRGHGIIEDGDGSYDYSEGSVCIVPAGVSHKVTNTSATTNEYIFIRIHE
jgi:mannose-6-phosphate isomerase-like protein (cupin superfamily)